MQKNNDKTSTGPRKETCLSPVSLPAGRHFITTHQSANLHEVSEGQFWKEQVNLTSASGHAQFKVLNNLTDSSWASPRPLGLMTAFQL